MTAPAETVPARLRDALAERYTLEREIGRGGMATVYLAQDVKHARAVAVKVLHPFLATQCCEPDRFLREIHFAARLAHPGIVPLHDSGERDGFLYYVMPFLPYETLRQRLVREGQLPIAEALRITAALGGALDYAHRQGVIHRDIKPENVLLHEGGPILADFGVARAVTESGRAEGVTDPGIAVGTPEYMSPEQASGESVIDARSDQYSLACVAYEMLAGGPPFAAGTSRALMARHVADVPERIRARRPEVPAAADAALARALAKDPVDRFATALEFTEALVTSDAPSVAVVAGAVAVAVLPFVNLGGDADAEYLADGITEELTNALAQADGLRVVSRTSAFAYKGRADDVRAIGARLGVSAVLEGGVRQSGQRLRVTARLTSVADGRHLWAERFDREAADVFALEDEIARAIVQALRATLLRPVGESTPKRYTGNVAAYRLYLKGRFAWNTRTSAGLDEAIRYFQQAIAEDPSYALAYTGLSDAHALHVDYRGIPVADGFARAKEFAGQALALDEGLAEAHTSLAWVLFIYDWDWDEAMTHFRRAIELNPAYATAHQWYAFPLVALGRIPEALAEGRIARELDPAAVAIRRSLGWLYYYARRYDEAVEHLRQGIALNPTAEETHRVLGMVHQARGAWAEAEASFREALTLSEESAYATAGLGATLVRAGRRDEGRALLDALQTRARERYVSPVAFATLYTALGDTDGAFEWIEKARAERRGWLAYLRVDPLLDELRGDSRFAELLREMRL